MDYHTLTKLIKDVLLFYGSILYVLLTFFITWVLVKGSTERELLDRIIPERLRYYLTCVIVVALFALMQHYAYQLPYDPVRVFIYTIIPALIAIEPGLRSRWEAEAEERSKDAERALRRTLIAICTEERQQAAIWPADDDENCLACLAVLPCQKRQQAAIWPARSGFRGRGETFQRARER